MGIFNSLKKGLSKTREILLTDVNDLFSPEREIDDDLLEELEETLIMSDLGMDVTMEIMEKISKKAKKLKTADELKSISKRNLGLCSLRPHPLKPKHKPPALR